MSNDRNETERDLRARFDALRLSDASLGAPFEATWRAARRRLDARRPAGLFLRRVLFATVSVALVVAAAVAVRTLSPPHPSIEQAIAQARELQDWSAPTDALLPTTDLTISGAVSGTAAPEEPRDSSTGVASPDGR